VVFAIRRPRARLAGSTHIPVGMWKSALWGKRILLVVTLQCALLMAQIMARNLSCSALEWTLNVFMKTKVCEEHVRKQANHAQKNFTFSPKGPGYHFERVSSAESLAESQIPKVIHQSWKMREIKGELAIMSNKTAAVNDDWTHVMWTDEENRRLIQEQYPWFLDCYDRYPYSIQRADAARYFYLHAFGGVYMDLDVTAMQKYNPYLEAHPEVHVHLGTSSSLEPHNALMISAKGHPFWKIVFEVMMEKCPRNGFWTWVDSFQGVYGLSSDLVLVESMRRYKEQSLASKKGIPLSKIKGRRREGAKDKPANSSTATSSETSLETSSETLSGDARLLPRKLFISPRHCASHEEVVINPGSKHQAIVKCVQPVEWEEARLGFETYHEHAVESHEVE